MIRLGSPAHGIVTKTVHKTLQGVVGVKGYGVGSPEVVEVKGWWGQGVVGTRGGRGQGVVGLRGGGI